MRATFAGLILAVVAMTMNDAVGQDSPPPKKDEAAGKFLKTQLDSARKGYRASLDTMVMREIAGVGWVLENTNHPRPDLAYTWSVRWLQAQRALSQTKEERLAAYVSHQKRMRALRDTIKDLGNFVIPAEVPSGEWYLAEAELWLLKERGK
jgi:hypothetical protein